MPTNAITGTAKAGRVIGAERRRQLIMVAYQLIVERGFEGLRTRDVAERVGINQATLHYYFPTKEELIRGVVGYLIEQYSAPHAQIDWQAESSMALVRAEFGYVSRLSATPALIVALDELALRALRDPVIAQLLDEMDAGWHAYLVDVLRRGVEKGEFCANLDVNLAARVLMTAIKGIRVEALRKPPATVEQTTAVLLAACEQWLVHG
jgi:AcrR family transcriptional regulator